MTVAMTNYAIGLWTSYTNPSLCMPAIEALQSFCQVRLTTAPGVRKPFTTPVA
ncbi:hypothetical protein PAMC26510_34005 [Caballeronia sordidicola]|uniref:Uncharacterized protein n=1 Tax=Caballeronia sordidicola TaxID=196367 RepID=A0A242M8B0_CABSO|nr:hypothetical protein PAMC26510_34005 [Caballeronia sordidicola]